MTDKLKEIRDKHFIIEVLDEAESGIVKCCLGCLETARTVEEIKHLPDCVMNNVATIQSETLQLGRQEVIQEIEKWAKKKTHVVDGDLGNVVTSINYHSLLTKLNQLK